MSIGIKLGIFSELDAAAAAGGGDGGWDGEPGTILLTPSADGSTSDWTLAQGSSKWEVVGIASGSSDGAGSGGGDSGWGAYSGDRICYPANAYSVAGWNLAYCTVRENSTTTWDSYANCLAANSVIWLNSNIASRYVPYELTTRPSDGGAWTLADIESLEIGLRSNVSDTIQLFEVEQSVHILNTETSVPATATIDKVSIYSMAVNSWTSFKSTKSCTYCFQMWGIVDYS